MEIAGHPALPDPSEPLPEGVSWGSGVNTWSIPFGDGVVRHMVATPGGKIFLACSGVHEVAIAQVTR